MPFEIKQFQKRTIVRHRETLAFEIFYTLLATPEHTYMLSASSSSELEILWQKLADIPMNFEKIEKALVIACEPIDENRKEK
jgi:hypothetical protein